MPQHIERFAVAGSIDEVKERVLSILNEIGVEVSPAETSPEPNGDKDQGRPSFNEPEPLVPTRILGSLTVRTEGEQDGIETDLRVEIDLSVLSDSKTSLRVGVFLQATHQFRLTQICAFVANKIVRNITSVSPAIELRARPMQMTESLEAPLSRSEVGLRAGSVALAVLLIIGLALVLGEPRRFLDGGFDHNLRITDQYKQNLVFDHSADPEPEERAGPPTLDFVLISVMRSSGKPDLCRLRVDMHKPPRLGLTNLEFKLLLVNSSGWLMESATIKFDSLKNDQISRYSRWIWFPSGVCERISMVKIENVPRCAVADMSFSKCRSLVKSDPKSPIEIRI